MADYLEAALKKIEEFEGSVPWMYRDAAGHVTAGVGLLLANADAAAKLPFFVGERAAEPDEISAEFRRVDALPMGRPAQFYRRDGGPELTAETMDGLLRAVVAGVSEELAARVKGFNELPDGVKVALLDMAYSLGIDGLMKDCPRLIRRVEAGDWVHAGRMSFRHGAVAGRNEWTRKLLLAGFSKGPPDGRVKRLGYGVLGMVASWMGR